MQHKSNIMDGITINDSLPLAALTVGQAKEIICGLVSQELKKAVTPKEKPVLDIMNIDDALRFLKEQGLPMTKATLYNKTFKGTIPFKRVGKRVVFSRIELSRYLESRTTRPETKADAALRLSENARKR